MALEISEIGIRMHVRDETKPRAEHAAGDKAGQEGDGEESSCCGGLDRAQVVDDCVRRVLRILKQQQER